MSRNHDTHSTKLPGGRARAIWYDRYGNPITSDISKESTSERTSPYSRKRRGRQQVTENTDTALRCETTREEVTTPSRKKDPGCGEKEIEHYQVDGPLQELEKSVSGGESRPDHLEQRETVEPSSRTVGPGEKEYPNDFISTSLQDKEEKVEVNALPANTEMSFSRFGRRLVALSVLYLLPLSVIAVAGVVLLDQDIREEVTGYDVEAFESRQPYRYLGSFTRDFGDLNDLQLEAARTIGIRPAATRAELRTRERLVPVEDSPVLSIDHLTHSQALLVPEAAVLLSEIATRFADDLSRKHLPAYSIIVTSMTRTEEDVKSLRRRNGNASNQSTHAYGTTFDISWKRFHKEDPLDPRDLSPEELKHLLATVLAEFRSSGRCYIKHEKNQACFHITTIK